MKDDDEREEEEEEMRKIVMMKMIRRMKMNRWMRRRIMSTCTKCTSVQ